MLFRSGNTNITFDSPKTVYWNFTGTGVQKWSSTSWATSSGGTPGVNNFPLAQDTAVFDNAGTAGTVEIDAGFSVGTVNMSSRTSTMDITCNPGNLYVFGDFIVGSGVSLSPNGTYPDRGVYMQGRSSTTLTTAEKTFQFPVYLDSYSGTVTLQGN